MLVEEAGWGTPLIEMDVMIELLKGRGQNPTIVLYLDTPPALERIAEVISLLGVEPRDPQPVTDDRRRWTLWLQFLRREPAAQKRAQPNHVDKRA